MVPWIFLVLMWTTINGTGATTVPMMSMNACMEAARQWQGRDAWCVNGMTGAIQEKAR